MTNYLLSGSLLHTSGESMLVHDPQSSIISKEHAMTSRAAPNIATKN